MSKPALSWSLHEKIPSSLDVGHATIERLLAALEANHWEGRDLFHIQLAIEEALVNAITHGNKQADDKVVEVEFRVDQQNDIHANQRPGEQASIPQQSQIHATTTTSNAPTAVG